MRRFVPVLAFVLALVAGTASATTLASRFAGLDADLSGRLAQIPATHPTKLEKAQKAALKKALAALAVDTDDLGRTVGNAKKAIGAVDRVFPADATFDPVETAVVDALESDASLRNGGLARALLTLSPGKPQTRGQAKSTAAAATLLASQTGPTHVARLKLIASAVASIVAGEKIVKRAGGTFGGGVTSTQIDVDINTTATHLHVPAAMPPFGLYSVTYDTAADTFTLNASAPVNGVQHTFAIVVPGHGTGSRTVPAGGQSIYFSPSIMPPMAPATGGTINFTTWDLANTQVGGTFDVNYSNGTNAVHLATGTFSSLTLIVQ